MSFYKYEQNNSGGGFDVDDKLCHRVIIEAESAEEAEIKAKSFGIYFNGVESGRDCPCCGDRWSDWNALVKFPIKWDKGIELNTIEEYCEELFNFSHWTTPGIRIFYRDGSVKEY